MKERVSLSGSVAVQVRVVVSPVRMVGGMAVRLKILGGLLLLPSLYFLYKANATNTYLSTAVRIQSERGHKVIQTGVYSFVRHPMYLGAILMFIGAPILLGSLFGLVTSIFIVILLMFRIIGEEKMLLEDLEGYGEYMKKVRYRLIPLFW